MPQPAESGNASEGPRDVLAAEEFVVPTVDPVLRHRAVRLPADPTGIAEPHDVLAAEEFAMPAPYPRPAVAGWPSGSDRSRVTAVAGMLLAIGLLVRAMRRR
jgi:hypothetical protein